MRRLPKLDRKGAAAAEFAIVVPVLLVLIFAVFQVGVLFFANAGLKHGLGEAARSATLWPRRNDAQIIAQFRSTVFGVDQQTLADPVITTGRIQGADYVDISVSYTVPLNLFVIPLSSITLTDQRRAFLS